MPSKSDPPAPEGGDVETTATESKSTRARKSTTTKRKGRASAARAAKKTSAGKLRVRQIRSTVRRKKTFKATLDALGIRHHQDEVVVSDTPSTRGMLRKVQHLVRVTPEE